MTAVLHRHERRPSILQTPQIQSYGRTRGRPSVTIAPWVFGRLLFSRLEWRPCKHFRYHISIVLLQSIYSTRFCWEGRNICDINVACVPITWIRWACTVFPAAQYICFTHTLSSYGESLEYLSAGKPSIFFFNGPFVDVDWHQLSAVFSRLAISNVFVRLRCLGYDWGCEAVNSNN